MWTLTLPLALVLSNGAADAVATPVPAAQSVSPSAQESTYRDVEGSAQLTEQGWLYIPTYTGEHRWSLSAEQRARTLAGWHLLSAATALDDENTLAWWRRGHAAVLLSTDNRTRGTSWTDAEYFANDALQSLERSRRLTPDDTWSAYALAVWQAELGALGPAIEGLRGAIEQCAPGIEAEGPDGTSAWIAFKCREWTGELQMRAGQFDEARDSIQSFYDDFGENAWPLRIALGECALRERNFAGAREQYAWIVAQEEFAGDPQAHAMLGYLEGLLGHPELADRHLNDAISRERTPALYARLWQWLLVPERRAELRPGLDKFLAFPPPQLSEWDLRLGRFVLGDGHRDSLLIEARVELARRWEAGEDPGDLMCEANFYQGLRHELEANGSADAFEIQHLRERARTFYAAALSDRPRTWKWEWAFARIRDASLDAALPSPGPEFGSWRPPENGLVGERNVRIHRLGMEQSVAFDRAEFPVPQVGDLLLVCEERHDAVAAFALLAPESASALQRLKSEPSSRLSLRLSR